jgi:transcription elongation GreA/GreB family factor
MHGLVVTNSNAEGENASKKKQKKSRGRNLQIVQDPAKKTKISVGRVVTLKTHYSGK